jgi:hypothetical protein
MDGFHQIKTLMEYLILKQVQLQNIFNKNIY